MQAGCKHVEELTRHHQCDACLLLTLIQASCHWLDPTPASVPDVSDVSEGSLHEPCMKPPCVACSCVSLQLAQVVAARSEFVPAPVCAALATLHDRVPQMSPATIRAAIQRELGGAPLESVFEWIDLDTPLGSASVAQVSWRCLGFRVCGLSWWVIHVMREKLCHPGCGGSLCWVGSTWRHPFGGTA